jgi:uncharacterized protein (DUF4415 family)
LLEQLAVKLETNRGNMSALLRAQGKGYQTRMNAMLRALKESDQHAR